MADIVYPPLLKYAGKLLSRFGGLTNDPDCCCPCPAYTIISRWEASQGSPPGPNDDNWQDFITTLLQDEINNPHLWCDWKTRAAVAYYQPPGGGGIYPTCGYVSMVHQNCTTPGDTTCLDERLSTLGTAFFGNDRLINTIDVGQPATCALLRAEIDRFYNLDQCTCVEEGDEPGQEYLLNKYLRNCGGKDIACGNVNQITPNCDI